MSDPHDLDYRVPDDDVSIEDQALTGGISPLTTASLVLGATLIAVPGFGFLVLGIGVWRLQRTPRRATRERLCAVICLVLAALNFIATWWWIDRYS